MVLCGLTWTGHPTRLLSLRRHRLWTSEETSKRGYRLSQGIWLFSAFKAFARMDGNRKGRYGRVIVSTLYDAWKMLRCSQILQIQCKHFWKDLLICSWLFQLSLQFHSSYLLGLWKVTICHPGIFLLQAVHIWKWQWPFPSIWGFLKWTWQLSTTALVGWQCPLEIRLTIWIHGCLVSALAFKVYPDSFQKEMK